MWEEDEFWIELSWQIDPTGNRDPARFRKPVSARRKNHRRRILSLHFRELCARLARAATEKGLDPLQYMRKYGAFEITRDVYKQNEKPVARADLAGSKVEATG